jgi:hypothetical protein
MEKKNNKTAISTKYSVSEHTAGWANLHHAVSKLWGDIYELLEHENELQDMDERFSEEFEKPLLSLMNAVENGLSQSVLENFRTNKESIVL